MRDNKYHETHGIAFGKRYFLIEFFNSFLFLAGFGARNLFTFYSTLFIFM